MALIIVLAEALDRLSRDREDVAGLFKRLNFAGIKIITLSEGEISELHIGLKGTMNALFLKDLADKTHRGLRGRIAAGKSAGGLCYGYRVIRQLDAHAEPIRGDHAIDEDQALITNRIFEMFAQGNSPVAIAMRLNRDSIPGPAGRAWRDTTIRGHATRGTGILRNELYTGRLIDAITEGFRTPDMKEKLEVLTEQKAALKHRLAEPHTALPALHPQPLSELYRTKVANLQEALTTQSDNAEVIERLRDLIDRVDVGPAVGTDGADSDMPAIVLTGAIDAMLHLTMS